MTSVEVFCGASASEYHGREMPAETTPHVWVFEPIRPALVLGSTQADSIVDHEAARSRGVEVVRRRSGGGAVLLVPGEVIWIDVVVPREHHLWSEDVGEAPVWLGRTFRQAILRSGLGEEQMRVHVGAMETSQWSTLVCFAGRGPGEVFDDRGAKIVGISQRRTRDRARFQCAVSLRWNPEFLMALLAAPRPDVSAIASAGASIASGSRVDVDRLRVDLVNEVVDVLDGSVAPTAEPRPG